MGQVRRLMDTNVNVQSVDDYCVIWTETAPVAMSCYRDKYGITRMVSKMVKYAKKGPYVMLNGKRYYITKES